MSSVLSFWFYTLVFGIITLLLVALVFIFFAPNDFFQLTSQSGQVIDLSGIDAFDPTSNATIAATADLAVIKVGQNVYSIANDTVTTLPNAFVAPLPSGGSSAATDIANSIVSGTLVFWLLMLGIAILALVLAYMAIIYPEKLFSNEIASLVAALPKKKTSCSSHGCSASSMSSGYSGACPFSKAPTKNSTVPSQDDMDQAAQLLASNPSIAATGISKEQLSAALAAAQQQSSSAS